MTANLWLAGGIAAIALLLSFGISLTEHRSEATKQRAGSLMN